MMIPADASVVFWALTLINAIAIAFCVWCGIDLFRIRSKAVATAICLSISVGVSAVLVAMANFSLQ